MNKTRLEAFSDGVIAIIITIMVLELKVPEGTHFEDLRALFPVFLSYILSFIYVAIYWSNHHHMLHTVEKVSGSILWGNLHLLFWLSLIPFATGWLGENHFTAAPTALYGVVLLMCSVAYLTLQSLIVNQQGSMSLLRKAIGRDWKGKASLVCYTSAVLLATISPLVSQLMYIFVAIMWLIPDKRIEHVILHD